MSRLNELIRQLRLKDPALADDLEREVGALADRRAFGLNFERHTPEVVELPGRRVRRGDKVRILPPRGTMLRKSDEMLWRVTAITRDAGRRTAQLEALGDEEETTSAAVDNLVVVAKFRDPIYPGLVSTDRIERGGSKPFHAVINAENYHALQALLFAHRGEVDCIYIDPPYNTGAKDWKYNNSYVESDDLYRHSKWLAFMERRLLLAKELLNPHDSALIVTIDDKELSRLGLLLEQIFPEAKIEMVTSVINPRGKYRANDFARCEEYIYFVTLGNALVQGEPDADFSEGASVAWRTFRRSDISSARGTPKGGTGQFFPIYVDAEGRVSQVGEALAHNVSRAAAPDVPGSTPVFPIREEGTEMNWGLTAQSARRLLESGYLRVGRQTPDKPQKYELSYLTSGRIADIESNRATVVGHNPDGSVIARYLSYKVKMPVTTWNRESHNAEINGTELLKRLLGGKAFPYPKSMYAVEDALRLFTRNKRDALIIDFFSGSGTTAHAVMRLNRQDGGRRRSVLVTNNEVSADEQSKLRKDGLRPGDPDWEKWGICDYITKPRIEAAITGRTPDGEPIKGDYKFTDEFPMAEGFEENVEFFTLTYEAPLRVASNREFERIGPLLWLRAGSRGRPIDDISKGWDVADAYGVIADFDHADEFVQSMADRPDAALAFVVTDEDWLFESMCRELPAHVEPVRLYEAYLRNFELESGRGAR